MSGPNLKLLIVDDDAATRILLSQIFTHIGYSVRYAEDGFSALRQMREVMPDLLLSDLHMPGMSGFELLSVVRRRLPSIYVIATSGAYAGESVPEGIAADAFYEKASEFRALLKLVQEAALSGRKSVRTSERLVPVWLSRTGDEATGQSQVMICCPDCLRAFSLFFDNSDRLFHETDCVYCAIPIQFAIVQPLDPLTSQPYHAKVVRPVLPLLARDGSAIDDAVCSFRERA
jgi:CheY-like chemotaxis protein